MKNIKKMMLALTMLTLGSAYISADDNVIDFFPGKGTYNSNNLSGRWYKDTNTAVVNPGEVNEQTYTNVKMAYVKSKDLDSFVVIGQTKAPVSSSGTGVKYSILHQLK